MIGNQERWQEDLFIAGPLRDLIPEDHILKQVDRVLDLSWLREEVRDLYNERQGRPSIDPETAVRLMLAGFFQSIVHDRKLMREAQVNLAIRWFAGYRLNERLPDHSSLTRIRQRWGSERFKRIFQKTVELCSHSGLVNGETLHVDATLIRADVSWASLSAVHADRVIEENEDGPDDSDPPRRVGRPRKRPVRGIVRWLAIVGVVHFVSVVSRPVPELARSISFMATKRCFGHDGGDSDGIHPQNECTIVTDGGVREPTEKRRPSMV